MKQTIALAALLVAACQSSPALEQPAPEPPPPVTVSQPAPPSPPAAPAPIEEIALDDGYAQFVNRIELPNTVYEVRGVSGVRIYEQYVVIVKPDITYVIPRERFIYAGREI